MRRTALLLGFSAAASALALNGGERSASACGGCFHPPTQVATDITDERMLLSVSPKQTTLYDQIRYSGNPTSFAWVLPIHGTVDVGLSADVLFDSIDTMTVTTIIPPEPNCPGPPSDCLGGNGFAAGGAAAPSVQADDAGAAGGVVVTKAQNVGPYETVQLHSTDSSALETWLQQNGFDIPVEVKPVIDQYVKEGSDFLAMKLLPDQGVQAMRPVRVTTQGASFSLPLRMAAIGTGQTVGITIWVVSDGRYEPQNFPFFHIVDTDLVWDFAKSISNYSTLRASNEQSLGGKGWEIESSISLNETLITNVIMSGGQYYGGGGGGGVGYPSYTEDAGADYLAVPADDAGAGGQSADDVRTADIAALFAGMTGPSVRVTRMRSDISHAAMTADFVIQASADQSEMSNTRTVTKSINLQCPIYDNCTVVGTGTPQQAQTSVQTTGRPRGCVTSSRSSTGSAASFGTLAGALGLVAVRWIRARRRSRKS